MSLFLSTKFNSQLGFFKHSLDKKPLILAGSGREFKNSEFFGFILLQFFPEPCKFSIKSPFNGSNKEICRFFSSPTIFIKKIADISSDT